MNYSKELIEKIVTEEREKILSWLKDYDSMNPDITICKYNDDIDSLCDGILKRFGLNTKFGDYD